MKAFVVREDTVSAIPLHKIKNNGWKVALYETSTGRHVAIRNQLGNPMNGIKQLVIEERHKVALYKQAMQMQMGRKPQTETVDRKIVYLREIQPSDDKGYVYKVYTANTFY